MSKIPNKKIIAFPDPNDPLLDDIVFVGGELSVENALSAYSKGIFPWPHGDLPLLWFCPLERGVLQFKNFKIPRSVLKELKKKEFRITFDQDFSGVIESCALTSRKGQPGTWITAPMIKTYKQLFALGHAHSVECWSGDELVGGLYGVYIQNVFSGESMFFNESGASKACLIGLVGRLKEMGHTWMDIQMVTPVLELFGGTYVSRSTYLKNLRKTQLIARAFQN